MITKAPSRFVNGSLPEPGDSQFQIPAMLMPVSTVPGLLQSINPGAAVQQVESFCQDNTQSVAPSTASGDANIVLLGAGLWRLLLDACVIGDYTPAVASNVARITIVAPGSGTKAALLYLSFAANVHTRGRLELVVNLPSNGWIIQMTFAATGVGQNAIYQIGCQGLRLAG